MNYRNVALFALVFVFLFSAVGVQTSAHAAPMSAAPVTAHVIAYRLNLRADAGVKAARIAVLKQGETLTVLEQKKVGRIVWYKVQTVTNQVGWVISYFIKAASGNLTTVPAA